MFCRWCGSEIPEDTRVCPHCGKVLRTEEDITPERENTELEEEIEQDMYTFFNKNKGSAFSENALKNRLNEIVIDYNARAYSSQHLQKILYKMTQKKALTLTQNNNETYYLYMERANKEPPKPASNSNVPQKIFCKKCGKEVVPHKEPKTTGKRTANFFAFFLGVGAVYTYPKRCPYCNKVLRTKTQKIVGIGCIVIWITIAVIGASYTILHRNF